MKPQSAYSFSGPYNMQREPQKAKRVKLLLANIVKGTVSQKQTVFMQTQWCTLQVPVSLNFVLRLLLNFSTLYVTSATLTEKLKIMSSETKANIFCF